MINPEYRMYTLNDVGELKRGVSKHRPRNDERLFGGDYPFIQTGDVKSANWKIRNYSQTYNEFGLSQSKLWEKGTLCITIAANIAETAILDIDACFPDSVLGFKANEKLCNTHYIEYMLRNFKSKLVLFASQTAQKNINLGTFQKAKFPLPDKETQDKIVSKIMPFDLKIELNEREIETLEEYSKLLFHKWFIDFNFPDEYGNPYKDYGGKMNEIDRKLIPTGWKFEKIENFIEIKNGISYKSEDIQSNKGIPMINLGSFGRSGAYKAEEIKFYSGDYTQDKVAYPFDLVVACTDLTRQAEIIGMPVLIPDIGIEKYLISCDAVKVALKNDDLSVFYLSQVFKQIKYKKYIKGFANGTNVLHLAKNGITNFVTVIPSPKVLSEFNSIALSFEKKKSLLLMENQLLTETRDLLIRKLIK